MKKNLLKLPEYYLIVLVVISGYLPPFSINPIFIGIVIILILQIIFKNKISGILLGFLFFLMNLFFLGAVISEFNEFTQFSSSAKQLLFGDLSLWVINLATSLTMIYKYSIIDIKRQIEYNQQ